MIIDSKSDQLIKVIDLRTNELKVTFGKLGQGPAEFIGASQIIPDQRNTNKFWIFDVSTRNLKKYDINSVLNNDSYPEEIIRITSEDSGFPFHLVHIAENLFLGTGLFIEGRIAIFDMNGKLIELIGKLPVVLKNGEFAPQHSHGFEANLIYKENTKKIYLATRLGNIVEKYSLNGELISTFLGPDSFFPEYKIVPAGSSYTMTYNKKSRFGYLDIRYNKNLDRLFLLYSGKSQNNTKSRPSLGNFVYVLDHKDKIIEKIILDNNIDQMIISDDGSTIFGASETDILKFDYNESSKGK